MTTTLPQNRDSATDVVRASPEKQPVPAVTHPEWCIGNEQWHEYDGIYHTSGDTPITPAKGDATTFVVGIDRLDEEPDEPGPTTIYLADAEDHYHGLSLTIPEALAVAEALLDRIGQATRRDPAEQYVAAADIQLGDQIWTSTEYGAQDGEDSREGWHEVCHVIAQPGEVEVIAHLDPEHCDWDEGLTYEAGRMVLVRRRGAPLDPGCAQGRLGRPATGTTA